MATIKEILADPRFEQFAAFCRTSGRVIKPAGFPWQYMGLTDAEFLALDLKLEAGDDMSPEMRQCQLQVLRACERCVVRDWAWWHDLGCRTVGGATSVKAGRPPCTTEAVAALPAEIKTLVTPAPVPAGGQGLLF
jgi:hypothetical protein